MLHHLLNTHWYLIANASRARIVAAAPDGRLRVLHAFEHLESRRKSGQLREGRAGRELSGRGFGGAAFEPRVDAHRKEHQRFARQLMEFLEHEARANLFDGLTVFATHPFLGELRKAQDSETARRLKATHGVDLSHVGIAELQRRIEEAAMQPQRSPEPEEAMP